VSRAIAELRNLEPVMAERLAEIGVNSEADLRRMGAPTAWQSLRHLYGRGVTRNALHAMQSTILGCDWRALPKEVKAELDAAVGPKPSRPRSSAPS
jgi:DNA transformation protein and related proteins